MAKLTLLCTHVWLAMLRHYNHATDWQVLMQQCSSFNQYEAYVQHQDLPAIALGESEGVGSGVVKVCSAIARLKGAFDVTIIVPASWPMLSGATLIAVGRA